ncbi:MAG: DUF2304 domain-containing protein [Anaerorhabdus sp.]|uniref:DUF2304 domain-containing protein n=1 Tax=Anaerorhabdus sp. TaxID=1872524 RepID=UPI002FC7358F
MHFSLQFSLLFACIITLIFIFYTIKKTRMNIRYAIVWISWGLVVLILSIFPKIIDYLSYILKISLPVNTIFLIFMFLLYVMSFYLFVKVSQLSVEIKTLTYTTAVLKKELTELRKKENKGEEL